jgi:hypothetical protein
MNYQHQAIAVAAPACWSEYFMDITKPCWAQFADIYPAIEGPPRDYVGPTIRLVVKTGRPPQPALAHPLPSACVAVPPRV